MFDHPQRLSGGSIDQPVFRLAGDLLAQVENDVRSVGQAFRLAELAAGSLIKVFARLFLLLGKLLPGSQYLGIDAERSDARRDEILIPRIGHQRELPGHDRHDRIQRHDVRMVADARTRGVQRIVEDIASQILLQHVQKRLLAARKKVLTDAAAHIVIFIVGDLLLVIAPARPFHTLIMFVGIFGVGIHHVLVVRTVVSHLAGLAVGMLFDRVEELLAARDVEYPVKFLHGPVVQLAQRPGTGTVVSGRKLSVNLLIVLVDPLPNRTLLGMQLGLHQFRGHTVTRTEDILPDRALEGQLLPPLLALDEETELLGKRPQRLDDISGSIASGTAGPARHTLAAIPDHIAAHELLDRIVVLRLHDIDDLTGIVIVKLRRRADTRTHAAIHARMKALPHPHILHQHIEILTHTKKITSQQQSYPFPRYRTVVEIPIFAVCNVRTQRGKGTPFPKQTTRCQ